MRLHPPLPVLGLLLALAAGPALAATFEVTNLSASGPGSLLQAVLDANAAPGADEVVFQAGLAGTITLASTLQVTDDLVVTGPGAGVVTVSGNDAVNIFRITDGGPGVIDVSLSGLTLTLGSNVFGGAVFVQGERLTLQSMVLSNSIARVPFGAPVSGHGGNLAAIDADVRILDSLITGGRITVGALVGGPGFGGNIYVQNGSTTIERSTISFGSAGEGGGIDFFGGTHEIRFSTIANNTGSIAAGIDIFVGALTIDSSTLSGNRGGAALKINTVTVDVRLTTIADNDTSSPFGPYGGIHVFNDVAILNLDHSIVANNGSLDLLRAGNGTINAVWSLIENPGDAVNGMNLNNRFGIDPLLGPLADNGGPTLTHALLPGSPALDAGDPAIPSPPPTDQRGPGFVRIFNSRIDLGSFERQTADGAVEIPVLSPLSMAALMALLAGLALWTIRRS